MPIYEFECAQCKTHFEELVRGEDELSKTACPKCSAKKVRRVYSVFGFRSGNRVVSPVSRTGGSCRSCTTKTCDTCG